MESTVRTLADLDEEFGLHAYCNVCHRMERLDRAVLERELGPNVELERITRGLRCSGCGSRGARLYKSRSCRTMRSRRFINAEELDVDVRGPGDRASVRGSGDPDRERDRYAHQPPAPSVRPSVVRAPCPRFGRNAKNCSMRVPNPAARDADAQGTRKACQAPQGRVSTVVSGKRPLRQWCFGPNASLARTVIGVLTLVARPVGRDPV